MFKDRGATRKRAARHTAGYAVPLLTPGEPTRAPDVLLFVLREAEVDATVARVEPALGDRLGAGVEVDASMPWAWLSPKSESFQPPKE